MTIAKFLRTALTISVLFVGLVHSAKADLVTYNGDTTGGPTFHRPLVQLNGLSGTGTNVAYQALEFTVGEDGDYSFVVSGLGFDTVLFLYRDAFTPDTPLVNAITGSDDLVSGNTSGFSEVLEAGRQYVAVVTGFNNSSYGQYALTVAGAGVITAVPEPTTWLMLGVGLAALAGARRRPGMR